MSRAGGMSEVREWETGLKKRLSDPEILEFPGMRSGHANLWLDRSVQDPVQNGWTQNLLIFSNPMLEIEEAEWGS